jgi:hypothetical protein
LRLADTLLLRPVPPRDQPRVVQTSRRWVGGWMGEMDACVRPLLLPRHIFASTVLLRLDCCRQPASPNTAPKAMRGASSGDDRATCAWCMVHVAFAWYLAVACPYVCSRQASLVYLIHPHPHTCLTYLAALEPLLLLRLLLSQGADPSKMLTHQTHGVLRLNRSSPGRVTMSDPAVQAQPIPPGIGGATIMR